MLRKKHENNYFHGLLRVICLQPQCTAVVVMSDNPQTKKGRPTKMKIPLLDDSSELPRFLS